MIIALWLSVMGVAQTVELTVGSSPLDPTNSLPIYANSRWSYSQQIYYPYEIGYACMISSISFLRVNTGVNNTLDELFCQSIQVFLKNTDKQQFDGSKTDWIPVTIEDLVYEGFLLIPAVPDDGSVWVTIELATPFYYDGTSNLAVIVCDSSGNFVFGGGTANFSQYNYGTAWYNGTKPSSDMFYNSNYSEAFCPHPLNYPPLPTDHGTVLNATAVGNATNTIKMAVTVADGPVVEIIPNSIDFGDSPNGAWKHPKEVLIKNVGLPGTLQEVNVTGDYFTVSGENTPAPLPLGARLKYRLSTGSISSGLVSENLEVTYSNANRETITVPVTANAYDPMSPDVYELAEEVDVYPYSDTPASLHNDYQLPGNNEDGLDAVYKMTFDNDMLFSANVENGSNPKIAIYAEDFSDNGGPYVDNVYTGPSLMEPSSPVSDWLYYDDDNFVSSVGGPEGMLRGAVMFTPEQLSSYKGCSLDRIRFYDSWQSNGQMMITICVGGVRAPGRKITSQSFTLNDSNGWKTIELEHPVLLDITENLWVCFSSDEVVWLAPGCNYCGDPNSCWWFAVEEEQWMPIFEVNSNLEYSWMVRAFVTNEDGSREIGSEGEINQMTVEAGTYYLVASSTDEGFQVNINAETIPLPIAASNPTPANGADDLMPTAKLQWSFGQYTTGYRLLFGTTNPPQEVVLDWTDELDNKYITGLLNYNTKYYWRVDERNSSGITQGEVWEFTTTLIPPKDLYVENDKLYEGDQAVLHWSAPSDRSFLRYNVYQNNVLIGNTTDTSFTVPNLAYNMTGYQYTVAAVYDEGESIKTDAVTVFVTGWGSVSGQVVEQDMVTPVADVTIKLSGWDELGFPQLYQFTTDDNGQYSGELYAGTYTAAALKEGYQNKVVESVVIQYQTETNVNFRLDEVYAAPGEVLAEDQGEKAKISWRNGAMPMEPQWLYYDNGYYQASVGSGGTCYWGINFIDMGNYAGMKLTKISYYDAPGQAGTITANIYLGGTSSPQRLVLSQGFTAEGADKFIEIELAVPVVIDGTEPLWITCFCDNMLWPASACPNTGDLHGRWVSYDGTTWVDVVAANSSLDYTWMLRGYLEDGSGNNRSLQYYNVYRSDCYDEESAELIASIMADTTFADYAWNALEMGVYKWGVSSVYQGNRREEGHRELQTLLSEGFEGGVIPEGWTQYGGDWDWSFTNAFAENTGIGPHTDSHAAFCNSDGESGTRNLVTPPIDLMAATSASLDFWYVLPDWDGDWDDLYVKYSTSPIGPWTTLWTASSDTWTWTQKTIDLTGLCGEVVYLDFVERDCWGYGAAIDDVTVTADITPSDFDFQTIIDEGFEDSAIPSNWSQYGGDWDWSFTNAFAENIGIGPHSGSRAAYCNSDGESGTRNLVTPPIDLSVAVSATLDFWYVLPDWDGDWDDLYVKYSTSSTGPWTTLWTASSDTWTWTQKTIDLTELCGGVVYLDFVERDRWGYGAAIDDVTITAQKPQANQPHESAIVWSNCLGKDMLTTVEVRVNTSNALSPEGTQVSFVNISEPGMGYDYEMTLDETGHYVWDEFRKGDYRYAIKLYGYESCADFDTISIWEPTSLYCLLEESIYPVENLYVSPTGWAKWTGAQLGDEFYYDFEDGSMGDWTLLDADGDGFNWKLGMAGGDPSIAGHQSTYCVYSESYDPDLGGLWPDNYLVSKKVAIGDHSTFSFYVCAQDEWWDMEHYGIAISTRGNTSPADFVTIWEETLTAKADQGAPNSPKGSRAHGQWYYKEIDLSSYAGQEVYIALRHFNCYDVFVIDVDDIRLSNGGRSTKEALRYKVMLDGVFVDNVEEQYLQHDVSSLVPGETYTTSVAAVFATGISDWVDYEWTYVPCESFEGAESLAVEVGADAVTLQWTWPEEKQGKGSRDGRWYYYDDGVCIDAIGTEAGLSIYWGVMFPAGQYEGNWLSKVSMYDREGTGHEGNIMIYQGGAMAPEQLLYMQPYETTGVNNFVEFTLNEPVEIDNSRNLWIVMNNTTGTYVASACAPSDDPNSGWVSLDGVTWEDVVNYGLYCSWMLRAYLETENYLGTMVWRDGELLTEIPIQGTTYLDENVSTEWHEYCIRVVHAGMPDSTYYAMSCPLCELADVTGIDEQLADGVAIYPNPTSGEVTIKADSMSRVIIVDMLGRKVYDQAVEGDEKTLNLSSFGSGVYLVNITTEKGVVNRRIVVHD